MKIAIPFELSWYLLIYVCFLIILVASYDNGADTFFCYEICWKKISIQNLKKKLYNVWWWVNYFLQLNISAWGWITLSEILLFPGTCFQIPHTAFNIHGYKDRSTANIQLGLDSHFPMLLLTEIPDNRYLVCQFGLCSTWNDFTIGKKGTLILRGLCLFCYWILFYTFHPLKWRILELEAETTSHVLKQKFWMVFIQFLVIECLYF